MSLDIKHPDTITTDSMVITAKLNLVTLNKPPVICTIQVSMSGWLLEKKELIKLGFELVRVSNEQGSYTFYPNPEEQKDFCHEVVHYLKNKGVDCSKMVKDNPFWFVSFSVDNGHVIIREVTDETVSNNTGG